MEICKDAAVRGIGTPEADDLALINGMTRRELGADEVYTFALRLCDNDIDRDHERFGDAALDQLASMFVGAPGVFDHRWSAREQAARIYRTEVVDADGTLTGDGRPCRFLKGWAYMMRTEENAALIAEIDGGIKREVSVGCAVEKVICSVCGRELDQCPHEKGEEYDGRVCHGILTGATDAYEWSFVAVPAQRNAGVMKALQPHSQSRLEYEAALGRKYLSGLRSEVVRLVRIAAPQLDSEVLVKIAGKLEADELTALKRCCEGRTGRSFAGSPQLIYRTAQQETGGQDGAFLI